MTTVKPFCEMSEMWKKVLRCSRRTVNKDDLNKEPSMKFRRSILKSEHSPIRKLKFEVFFDEIPYHITQQFSRHHIALNSDPNMQFSEDIMPTDIEHFVQTSRSDRTGKPRSERKQDDMVSYEFEINAQGLIDASKKRLCLAADADAVKYWNEVKDGIMRLCPELADKMQPSCVCKGFCPEDKSLVNCRYNESVKYAIAREHYKEF